MPTDYKKWIRTFLLVVFESGVIYVCGLAAFFVRFGSETREVLDSDSGWFRLMVVMVTTQSAFLWFGLYDFSMIRSLNVLVWRILQAFLVAIITIAAMFYFMPSILLGRGVVSVHFFLLLLILSGWRLIAHWMFAVEGRRLVELRQAESLPNPFVAGRALNPTDGQLFVGRHKEFLQMEKTLQSGVGLVIYGQRRIGKTSMLLHLPKRLPHDLLPVYLNLQRLMANTTGGFLHAVAREIVKQLPATLALDVPPEAAFQREPFLSFNQLLDDIEARLPQPQRVLLSFDEFEELEARVKKGKIDADIFTNLRGISMTGRRFTLLFAGLHTLEQMTQQYWHPFFQSVQPINIGYLSELDARQLITDPIEQFPLAYDEAAINRLTTLTNAHPYLTQSFCHNLVNRLNDPLHRANRATVADVEAVLDKTLETSGYYFDDYVWGWSTADERLTLTLLAEAGEEAAFSVVEQHLPRETALATTKSLRQRDILSEHTVAGELRFRFRIPLSRLWVLRTQSSARLLLERTVASS